MAHGELQACTAAAAAAGRLHLGRPEGNANTRRARLSGLWAGQPTFAIAQPELAIRDPLPHTDAGHAHIVRAIFAMHRGDPAADEPAADQLDRRTPPPGRLPDGCYWTEYAEAFLRRNGLIV